MSGAASRNHSLLLDAVKYFAVDDRKLMHKQGHYCALRGDAEKSRNYCDAKTLCVLACLSTRISGALCPAYTSSGVYGDLIFWRTISTVASTFRFTLHVQLSDEPPHPPFSDEDVLELISGPRAPEVIRRFSIFNCPEVTDGILPTILALPFLREFKVLGDCKFTLASQVAVARAGLKRRNWRLLETSVLSLSHRIANDTAPEFSCGEEPTRQTSARTLIELVRDVLAVRNAEEAAADIHGAAIALASRCVEKLPAEIASAAAAAAFTDVFCEVTDWCIYHQHEELALQALLLMRRVGSNITKVQGGSSGFWIDLVSKCSVADTLMDLISEKQGKHPCRSRRLVEDPLFMLDGEWIHPLLTSDHVHTVVRRVADLLEQWKYETLEKEEGEEEEDDGAWFSFEINNSNVREDSFLFSRLMAIKMMTGLCEAKKAALVVGCCCPPSLFLSPHRNGTLYSHLVHKHNNGSAHHHHAQRHRRRH